MVRFMILPAPFVKNKHFEFLRFYEKLAPRRLMAFIDFEIRAIDQPPDGLDGQVVAG